MEKKTVSLSVRVDVPTLQWGHGPEAVEKGEIVFSDPSYDQLQWGHGPYRGIHILTD